MTEAVEEQAMRLRQEIAERIVQLGFLDHCRYRALLTDVGIMHIRDDGCRISYRLDQVDGAKEASQWHVWADYEHSKYRGIAHAIARLSMTAQQEQLTAYGAALMDISRRGDPEAAIAEEALRMFLPGYRVKRSE